jgi:ATP-binding cassette subfamily B protein
MMGGRSGVGFQRRAQAGGGPAGRMFGKGSPDYEPVPRERRGRTLRRIVAFFRPYRGRVAIVTVAILATSLLGLINPILLKLLIDDALPSRDFGRLNLYVGLMIALPILTGLIGIGQSYLNNAIGQRVMQDLRSALYSHLQRMPLRFFTETKTGEIQSRLANDVGGVQGVVTDTASSIASNLAIAIGTIAAMILIDWRLTALSMGLLPFFMYLTYRVGKVRREVSTETQEALADLSSTTQETLSVSGMLLTKTFGQQEAANERFSGLNKRLAALQIRQAMVGRWFFMIVGTVFSITPAFVYWLAGFLSIQGDPSAPTIGDIVAFTTLQSRLFFPLGQLLNVQVEVQGALALFDRIFEYLELDPVIVDAPDAIDLAAAPVAGRIRFREVSFRYPSQPAVTAEGQPLVEALPFGVRGIDFEAAPGELVALVGPSGSGKTTTTYLVPRLYDVDAGAVEIDGTDVRRLSLVSLGRVIGFVTQETYLFHASVRENLLYAKPEATQDELERAARAAAIHDRVMELPQGYDTVVGERGYKLSGGEKQRIAIARVLLKDPRILILDEATSALDTVSERLIQRALEQLERGRTTIAIAHRLSTILRADQILVYDGGRIVERGTHTTLLAKGGLYAQLYHEQFEAAAEDASARAAATGAA